eukprot:GHVQ01014433.1.p1 GENE.GHVQ01014433.1~~GHVQ01014433.1.p1  ORF type:complete len:417 (-),score=129.90 GHVQ01014433.1:72-1253(-)
MAGPTNHPPQHISTRTSSFPSSVSAASHISSTPARNDADVPLLQATFEYAAALPPSSCSSSSSSGNSCSGKNSSRDNSHSNRNNNNNNRSNNINSTNSLSSNRSRHTNSSISNDCNHSTHAVVTTTSAPPLSSSVQSYRGCGGANGPGGGGLSSPVLSASTPPPSSAFRGALLVRRDTGRYNVTHTHTHHRHSTSQMALNQSLSDFSPLPLHTTHTPHPYSNGHSPPPLPSYTTHKYAPSVMLPTLGNSFRGSSVTHTQSHTHAHTNTHTHSCRHSPQLPLSPRQIYLASSSVTTVTAPSSSSPPWTYPDSPPLPRPPHSPRYASLVSTRVVEVLWLVVACQECPEMWRMTGVVHWVRRECGERERAERRGLETEAEERVAGETREEEGCWDI